MISSLSATLPKPDETEDHVTGRRQDVVGVVGQESWRPFTDCAGKGDHHEDQHQDERGEDSRQPPAVVLESSHSSLTLTAVSQPQ